MESNKKDLDLLETKKDINELELELLLESIMTERWD